MPQDNPEDFVDDCMSIQEMLEELQRQDIPEVTLRNPETGKEITVPVPPKRS